LFFVGEVAASVVEWRAVVVRLGMDGVNADAVVMRLMDAIVVKTFMVLQTCTINGINGRAQYRAPILMKKLHLEQFMGSCIAGHLGIRTRSFQIGLLSPFFHLRPPKPAAKAKLPSL
jgi:hypothetical protein